MNLDDLDHLQALDAAGLLTAIDTLPDQVAAAWAAGSRLTLPDPWREVRQVVLTGLGPAAVAAELAAARLAMVGTVPVLVWRDFAVPAFVGPHTLVLALSPDGEDEEIVDAARTAHQSGAAVLAVTGGGELAGAARTHNWRTIDLMASIPAQLVAAPLAVGLLAVLARLGLGPHLNEEAAGAVQALRDQLVHLRAQSPVAQNPAKRMAGQLMDRVPYIFAAEPLTTVARHWKTQINLLAKAPAVCDAVPEMDHNTIAGTLYPESLVSKHMVLELRSSLAHPRAQWLADQTRTVFMTAGFNTDAIDAAGDSPLAHMLTAVHYGDYAAFYLAMCYGVDPKI
jgi:glucose/mannose-6-phosphate isomerase